MFQMNIQEVVENVELSLRRSTTSSKFVTTVVQLLLARKEQRSRVLLARKEQRSQVLLLIIQQV